MNKVMLIGRFTRDPESRMGSNSMEISRFSLACQGDFVNKDGQRDVEFINCVAFNRTAQTINRFCKKGQQISVTGRIRNSSYDAQDGSKRYTTDIVVDQFEFLGSRGDSNQGSYQENNNYNAAPSNIDDYAASIETTDISEDPYKDFGEEINISSDDLPF